MFQAAGEKQDGFLDGISGGQSKKNKVNYKQKIGPTLSCYGPKKQQFFTNFTFTQLFFAEFFAFKTIFWNPPSPKGMHEPTQGAAPGFHPPPSPTRIAHERGTCDMCGSNSEGHDGGHIHHSSHHRQDIAKDQHVPLRTFKTGLNLSVSVLCQEMRSINGTNPYISL